MPTSTSTPNSPSTTMKRPLVDYEDSDDEDKSDDDDEDFWKDDDNEGNEAAADSSSGGNATAIRKGGVEPKQTNIANEPSKMPKFSADSSTSDPSSPPPDPEQQSGRQRASSHQDISTSS